MEQMGYEQNRMAVGEGSAGRSLLVYGITRIINDWIQQEPFTATKISLPPSFDKTPSAQTTSARTEAQGIIKSISHLLPGQGWSVLKCVWDLNKEAICLIQILRLYLQQTSDYQINSTIYHNITERRAYEYFY